MNIFLDSHNQAIITIVELCCERLNFNLTKEKNEAQLVIKDFDNVENIEEFDIEKTLFIFPKDANGDIKVKYKIIKPFLPTDLIKILRNFENTINNVPHSISEINNLIEEIDELDNDGNGSKDNLASESLDDFTPLEDLADYFEKETDEDDDTKEDVLSKNIDIDDDISLEDLATKFEEEPLDKSLQDSVFEPEDEDVKLQDLTQTKSQEEEKEIDVEDNITFDNLDDDEDFKIEDEFRDEFTKNSTKELLEDQNLYSNDELLLDDIEEIGKFDDEDEFSFEKLKKLEIFDEEKEKIEQKNNEEPFEIKDNFIDEFQKDDEKIFLEDEIAKSGDELFFDDLKQTEKADDEEFDLDDDFSFRELKKVKIFDQENDSLSDEKLSKDDEKLKIKNDLESSLNRVILNTLSKSEIKDALKDLDINITISFKDKKN